MHTFEMIVDLNIVISIIEDSMCKDLLEEVRDELEKRLEKEEENLKKYLTDPT